MIAEHEPPSPGATETNAYDQPVGIALPSWSGATPPSPITLEGRTCRLEPVSVDRHAKDLFAAYDTAPDGRDWTYLPTGPYEAFADYRAWLNEAESSRDPLHFAVIDAATDRAVGTMSLLRHDPANGAIEVGWVIFSPLMQRKPISTEAQFLLMRHVFDDLGYRRYEWKCDNANEPSRRAAARLGFTFEGVFRQAMVIKGRNRDTAWFALIDGDWPRVKREFERWLDPANFDADGVQLTPLHSCL